VEGLSAQFRRVFSARPHIREVEVTAHLHTAAEAPLADIAAEVVLLAGFMGVEADSVEAEVREVTANPGSLLPINLSRPIFEAFGLANLA